MRHAAVGSACGPVGDAQPADPASWSNKRRVAAVAGTICAIKKPDAGNVLKGIKDGCNGIVWADDAQVVRIMIEKRYSEMPSAVVHVVEVAGEAA